MTGAQEVTVTIASAAGMTPSPKGRKRRKRRKRKKRKKTRKTK